MWFTALCLAVRDGMQPRLEMTGPTYKAIEGAVFGSDPWRSNAIALLAMAHSGRAEIISSPNEMMKIANGFAIAGLPILIQMLEERGGDTALDHLSDAMETKLKS
jgi:hypothetical protein